MLYMEIHVIFPVNCIVCIVVLIFSNYFRVFFLSVLILENIFTKGLGVLFFLRKEKNPFPENYGIAC